MRASVYPEDPGYIASEDDRRRINVALDGVLQKFVLTADEEEGFLIRSVIGQNGRLLHDGDEFLTERVTGKVEISLKSQSGPVIS